MLGNCIRVFSIVFAVSYIIVGRWNKKKKQPNQSNYPPSLPCLPLVGSLPFFRKLNNITEFFMEKSHQLGPVFTFRVGNKLVLTLNDTETIVEAFVKRSRAFSSRPKIFLQKIVNPHNKGIVFMDTNAEFRRIHQSSLLALKEFGFGDKNIMEERILREVEAMIEEVVKRNGHAFDPKELCFLMSSNIIMNILFGIRYSYDLGVSEIIVETDRYSRETDMSFDVAPFLQYVPGFKDKITRVKGICERMGRLVDAEIDKSLENQTKCFVSEYINKEGAHYDREQLNFLLRDMVFAGTDTAALSFQWILVVLANRQDIQKKLQEEIDEVIPRDRLPTLQDQTKLTFVDAATLELFRWRSLVPLSVPRITSCDSTVRNYFIPAGTLVLPNIHAAHFDPNVWENPEEFRPERFLDKENKIVGRNKIVPFSVGRRSCLGEILARAEIFLILTSLLQRFNVLTPENQDKISDKPLLPMGITTIPTPYSVRLIDRYAA